MRTCFCVHVFHLGFEGLGCVMRSYLLAAGWIMIHESGVYSHPNVNGGWPFTEAEAMKKIDDELLLEAMWK